MAGEIDIFPPEPEDIALPQAGPERHRENRPQMVRRRVHEPLDLLGRKYEPAPLARAFLESLDALDGVFLGVPELDGDVEQIAEEGQATVDGGT